MKTNLLKVLGLILILSALIGCASKPAAASAQNANSQTMTAGRSNPDVPDWYLNPPQDPNYIYGIGSAKMLDADRSRRASEHRARNSLAFQLNAYVKAMEVDYSKEAGTTNDKAVVELFETVDRQLAAASLSGANISRRSIASDGTHYALISYPKNSAKDTVKGVISNAASREATIQANLALNSMDDAFSALSKPQPVETGE
jgi:hypothetical protein